MAETNLIYTPQGTIPNDNVLGGQTIKATMSEIGSVITNFSKDPANAQYLIDFRENEFINNEADSLYREKFALSNLADLFLHNNTIVGELEFSVHDDGQFIVDMIKKYRPVPIKQEYPFVVEM